MNKIKKNETEVYFVESFGNPGLNPEKATLVPNGIIRHGLKFSNLNAAEEYKKALSAVFFQREFCVGCAKSPYTATQEGLHEEYSAKMGGLGYLDLKEYIPLRGIKFNEVLFQDGFYNKILNKWQSSPIFHKIKDLIEAGKKVNHNQIRVHFDSKNKMSVEGQIYG